MSSAETLYITDVTDNTFTKMYLGKRAAGDLFDYLFPKLDTVAPEYKDQFAGEYYGEVLSITDFPMQSYPAVYNLIMSACDELESLKPYKAELQAALQADPRYKKAA